MSPAQRLQFDKAPSIFSQASRSLFARSSGTKNFQLPDLDAAFYGIVPDQKNIKAYSAICGFDTNSEFLPITYPHILGFKLHLELMLHRTFPLGPMGMVHLSNTVIQHRDIKKTESLDIRVLFDGHEKTDKGIEVKLRTETRVGMELVWEGSSTYLAIIPNKTAKKKEKKERPALPTYEHSESWSLPFNLGRKYGKISGDPNPIHMHPLSAKMFGLKSHIAHGMWTKARIAAALCEQMEGDKMELTIDFKLPIFLPGKVELHYTKTGKDFDFDVRNTKGDKIHIKGFLKAI